MRWRNFAKPPDRTRCCERNTVNLPAVWLVSLFRDFLQFETDITPGGQICYQSPACMTVLPMSGAERCDAV